MVEKSDERLLPTNKVRTIMKSCGDPSAFLSKESVLVVTKAAVGYTHRTFFAVYSLMLTKICFFFLQELFISYLTVQTHKHNAHKKDLNYNDLSKFVQDEEKLEFLHQIVPKKITVKEFREILERGSDSSDSQSSSSDDDDDEEDGDGKHLKKMIFFTQFGYFSNINVIFNFSEDSDEDDDESGEEEVQLI